MNFMITAGEVVEGDLFYFRNTESYREVWKIESTWDEKLAITCRGGMAIKHPDDMVLVFRDAREEEQV